MATDKEKKILRSRILQTFLRPFRNGNSIPMQQSRVGLAPRVGYSMLKGLEAAQQTSSPEEGLLAGIAAGLYGPTELQSILAERESKKQDVQRARISLIPDSSGRIHKVAMNPLTGGILSHEILKDVEKATPFTDRPLTLAEQQAFGAPAGTLRSQVKGQTPVAPEQRTKLGELGKAMPILKELRSGIGSLDLAESVATTVAKGPLLASQSLSPATKAGIYNAKKKAFLAQLSRASGERGVLTDQDIARIMASIPGFFDTKKSAEDKLRTTERIINEIQQRAEQALVGSPFSQQKTKKGKKMKDLSDNELLRQLEEEE